MVMMHLLVESVSLHPDQLNLLLQGPGVGGWVVGIREVRRGWGMRKLAAFSIFLILAPRSGRRQGWFRASSLLPNKPNHLQLFAPFFRTWVLDGWASPVVQQ